MNVQVEARSKTDVFEEVIARYVSKLQPTEKPSMLATVAQFIGRKIPFRPYIVGWDQTDKRPWLQVFNSGTYDLNAWILGWKCGDNTGVHDHMQSRAAIYLVQGELQETVYATDCQKLLEAGRCTAYSLVRHLYKGSLLTVDRPYVHDFENKEEGLAISVHVYGPRLEAMNLYEYQKNHRLNRIGAWRYA